MTQHIPSREQCQQAEYHLGVARDEAFLCWHQDFEAGRQMVAKKFQQAAAALGYTLQSPDDVTREKALVEAGRPLIAGLEDLPAIGQTWVLIDNLRILAKTLAAYDPPAVTSTPGAPHDGRAQPRGKDLLLAEEEEMAEAVDGLLGLITLILSRDDLSLGLREALTTNHRIDTAHAALKKVLGDDKP